MGLIARKRGNGKVVYYVTFWKDGKRIWELAGRDKQEAQRLEKKRNREVEEGSYARKKHPGMTVAAWAEVYFAKRKTRTADDEESILTRLALSRPWLARLKLEDAKRHHAQQLVDELGEVVSEATGKPLSPKYIANIHGAMHTMFEAAAFEEIIPANPWKVKEESLQRRSTTERQPYTPEEVLTLTVDERLDLDRLVWNALAFFTGQREGEVCGRRFRDWDRTATPLTCLTVKTQYDDRPLKTERRAGEQPRTVPVHETLAEILTWWWEEGFALVHARKPTLADFIVPQRNGESHTRSSAYKAFVRDCKKVGIEPRTLHATRHTFITFCRRGGARKDVLEKITHNAKGDIVDAYTHFDWDPLCQQVMCFWKAPGCDAACDARRLTAGNEWRRRESNNGDNEASSGIRGERTGDSSDVDGPQNPEDRPRSATKCAARHSKPTKADTAGTRRLLPGRQNGLSRSFTALPDAVQQTVADCLEEALPMVLSGDRKALLALERGARAIDGAMGAS